MDIHFYAIVLKDTEMAIAAKEKAEEILNKFDSCSSSRKLNFSTRGQKMFSFSSLRDMKLSCSTSVITKNPILIMYINTMGTKKDA